MKVGGRVVAPVDNAIWLFIKKSDAEWEEKEYPGFAFVPLVRDRQDKIKRIKDKGAEQKLPFILYLLSFIFLLSALLINEIYLPHAPYRGQKTVTVLPGFGSRRIGDLLKSGGIIRSKWVFVIYISLRGEASSLKPGAYAFRNASMPEIGRILVAGGENERSITIPEGWSLRDIKEYLDREGVVGAGEFQRITGAGYPRELRKRFAFLAETPSSTSMEGYLFPDTYRIFKNATGTDIVMKMLENFDRRIDQSIRADILRRKKSLFDIIRMASLIEKEVVSERDREIVSGILWKRLDQGVPLQVDATVIYAKEQRGERIIKDKVTAKDTSIPSPYNTYRAQGLPKGPISNPGLPAIRSALHPIPSPYLYYLSAPDGRTIFSKTLEEHNRAKAKYLKSMSENPLSWRNHSISETGAPTSW